MMVSVLPGASALQVGDKICVVGYIMDYFCIQRGTLFDNRSVETLGPGMLVLLQYSSQFLLISVYLFLLSSFFPFLPL